MGWCSRGILSGGWDDLDERLCELRAKEILERGKAAEQDLAEALAQSASLGGLRPPPLPPPQPPSSASLTLKLTPDEIRAMRSMEASLLSFPSKVRYESISPNGAFTLNKRTTLTNNTGITNAVGGDFQNLPETNDNLDNAQPEDTVRLLDSEGINHFDNISLTYNTSNIAPPDNTISLLDYETGDSQNDLDDRVTKQEMNWEKNGTKSNFQILRGDKKRSPFVNPEVINSTLLQKNPNMLAELSKEMMMRSMQPGLRVPQPQMMPYPLMRQPSPPEGIVLRLTPDQIKSMRSMEASLLSFPSKFQYESILPSPGSIINKRTPYQMTNIPRFTSLEEKNYSVEITEQPFNFFNSPSANLQPASRIRNARSINDTAPESHNISIKEKKDLKRNFSSTGLNVTQAKQISSLPDQNLQKLLEMTTNKKVFNVTAQQPSYEKEKNKRLAVEIRNTSTIEMNEILNSTKYSNAELFKRIFQPNNNVNTMDLNKFNFTPLSNSSSPIDFFNTLKDIVSDIVQQNRSPENKTQNELMKKRGLNTGYPYSLYNDAARAAMKAGQPSSLLNYPNLGEMAPEEPTVNAVENARKECPVDIVWDNAPVNPQATYGPSEIKQKA